MDYSLDVAKPALLQKDYILNIFFELKYNVKQSAKFSQVNTNYYYQPAVPQQQCISWSSVLYLSF